MVKLFVGGFPLDIEEMELAKLFAPHGDISTIKIVRDKKTRICKGYAFIEMIEREGAENAVGALNGAAMAGKVLTVTINEEAEKESPGPIPAARQRQPVYQKVIKPGGDVQKKRPRRSI
jgi:RNA recognition motif-containing protein